MARLPGAYAAIAIGGSAGSTPPILAILCALPGEFKLPLFVCTHLHASDAGRYAAFLDERSALTVVEARDKQPIRPGEVYVAPAEYHLLVERELTLALSTDERVCHCRPSIDVLFESAAYAYGAKLVGILLSGANDDGAAGLAVIQRLGGLSIAQDPASAEHPEMPRAAIERGAADRVMKPEELTALVVEELLECRGD